MPDLERKIAGWRKRMAAGGIKAEPVLDELESHLREDLERQMRSGMDEEQAFEAAARRIGECELLKAEFAKIGRRSQIRSWRAIGITCCVFAALLSLIVTPRFLTIPEMRFYQRVLGALALSLTLFSVCSWWFSYKYLPVIRNQRLRKTAVSACGFFGVVSLLIFANIVPGVVLERLFSSSVSVKNVHNWRPKRMQSGYLNTRNGVVGIKRFQHSPPLKQSQELLGIGISLLWALAFAAVLGGLAFGLEEAARRQYQKERYV